MVSTEPAAGQLDAAIERQQEVIPELNSHPEPTDTNAEFHEAYQRRQNAETTLIDAIRNGTIKVHNGRNSPIDNVLWKGHPHFGYYIELSMVRVPRVYDRRRFQPARIDVVQFDTWVDMLVPLVAAPPPTLTKTERCRIFLKDVFAGGLQRRSKDAYYLDASDQIPKLSRRSFDSVWEDLAPAEWKQPGRRRGT